MLLAEIKSIIKYAIELDIDYIENFLGYEGDKVLKITTKSKAVADLIEAYSKNIGLDCKSEYQVSSKTGPGYNVFIGVENPLVYKLKKDSDYKE
jgi:hypothetical protein